jgi:thioredoxin 1
MTTKNIGKIVILVVLSVAFVIFAVQQKSKQSVPVPAVPVVEETKPFDPPRDTNKSEKGLSSQKITAKVKKKAATAQKLPRLLDLGAGKCIPCKMMAPILEELRNEYKGKLQVEFIDVWESPILGDQYEIRFIPTQIFFDPSGKELFRHVGFMSKEDILAKWRELGFNLTA